MGLYAAKCMADCVDELGSAGAFDLFVHATHFFGHQVRAVCIGGTFSSFVRVPILYDDLISPVFPLQNASPLQLPRTRMLPVVTNLCAEELLQKNTFYNSELSPVFGLLHSYVAIQSQEHGPCTCCALPLVIRRLVPFLRVSRWHYWDTSMAKA